MWWYYRDGQQIGPIRLEELQKVGLRPEEMVWCEGMSKWTKASEVPELSFLFSAPLPGAPIPPLPKANYEYRSFNNGNYDQHPNQSNNLGNMYAGPVTQKNHILIWSILSTLFCCWPLGIVAIIFAVRAREAFNKNDYVQMEKYNRKAITFSIVSAVLGLVALTIFSLIQFVTYIFN